MSTIGVKYEIVVMVVMVVVVMVMIKYCSRMCQKCYIAQAILITSFVNSCDNSWYEMRTHAISCYTCHTLNPDGYLIMNVTRASMWLSLVSLYWLFLSKWSLACSSICTFPESIFKCRCQFYNKWLHVLYSHVLLTWLKQCSFIPLQTLF